MKHKNQPKDEQSQSEFKAEEANKDAPTTDKPIEIGGRKGPDPTRYGDWEKKGKCVDF